MRYLNTQDAPPPPPTAVYSHAVEAGGLLFVTGQLPVDPANPSASLPEGIEAQTERVLENLKAVCNAAGYRMEDAAFVRIYLTAFERDYPVMNKVYGRYFSDPARFPGRTTVGVTALGLGALVEIDMVIGRAGA